MGHPDKVADRISDAVLDHVLGFDAHARVACEVFITGGLLVIGGEIRANDLPSDLDDTIAALALAVDGQLAGVINVVAPNPVTNDALHQELCARLRRPAFVTVPGFAVRALLGVPAGELLDSKFVVPEVLESAGFTFRYPEISGALDDTLLAAP